MNVLKLHSDAIIPTRAYEGDIGYDLYALETITILPHSSESIRTGIAIELPTSEHVNKTIGALIKSKSGLSVKYNIECGAGVIDNGYRGELIVLLYNHSNIDFIVLKHSKIAQLLLVECFTPILQEVISMNTTERNENGFGSSGI